MEEPISPANNLTSDDVIKFGKEVGKDTVKQAIVWTLASTLAGGLKKIIEQVTKQQKG